MARTRRRDLKKELFWREMVRGQPGSGLSVRAWCRRHDVREPAFYWWRRRLADRGVTNSAASKRAAGHSAAAFVPVRVADDAIAAGVAAADVNGASAGRIEIGLAAPEARAGGVPPAHATPKGRFLATPKGRFLATPKGRFLATPKGRFLAGGCAASHLIRRRA